MNQSVRRRLDPAIGAIRISGRPISGTLNFARLNRTIANSRTREKTIGEGKGVNKRLERRANLPIRRRQCAIEFALGIIAATDQRTNAAAGVVDYYDCTFQIRHRGVFALLRRFVIRLERMMKIRLMFDSDQRRFERLSRDVLHGRIERGVDVESALVDLVLREQHV